MLIKKHEFGEVTNVVVVGCGLAGAVAAITAREQGAEVCVLEKQAKEGFYNNSSLSGGTFIAANDVKLAADYLNALSVTGAGLPWTEPKINRVAARYFAETRDWLVEQGGKCKFRRSGGEHEQLAGCESIDLYQYSGSGKVMMEFFYARAGSRGVVVRHDCRVSKLLTTSRGRVVGVRYKTQDGKVQDIGASRAVVLACGGFEFNEAMKLNFLKIYPVYFGGSPANTGDGVHMAAELGADLWHMNSFSGRLVAKFPEYPWSFTLALGGKGWSSRRDSKGQPEAAGYIIVDQHGERYTNENFKLHSLYLELSLFDSQALVYTRVPSYWIFDQNRIEAGPLPVTAGGPTGPHQLYGWSPDNSREIERGWIITADDPGRLAQKLDMAPAVLRSTIADYNRCCKAKKDKFGRRAADLVPLERPPFFALKLVPGGPNTQGGPRRNARAQVLNTDGDPIPGLYAAGELGSIFGMLYPSSGGNLAECIAFGRIAGENAARERQAKFC